MAEYPNYCGQCSVAWPGRPHSCTSTQLCACKGPHRKQAEEKEEVERVDTTPGKGDEVRVTSSTGAEKGTKLARYDLIPVRPLEILAEHYGRGARKYEDRNWEKGYDWSLTFAALNRHLWAFWRGEDIDPETGSPHMAAVAWHAFALLEFMEKHPEFDNRPAPTRAFGEGK